MLQRFTAELTEKYASNTVSGIIADGLSVLSGYNKAPSVLVLKYS